MISDVYYWLFVVIGGLLFLGFSAYIAFKMIYAEKYKFYHTEFNRIIGMLASKHHIEVYAPDDNKELESIRIFQGSKFCISYSAADSMVLLSWIRKIERIKEDKNEIRLDTE